MAYNEIQRAAFVPNPDAGPYLATYNTLAFPADWREPLLQLHRYGRSDRIKEVPISRLNTVLRAAAPDLVSVASRASFDDTWPWLYTEAEYSPAVMRTFIHAWLRDMQPSPESHRVVQQVASELDVASLEWDLTSVDMLQQTLSDDGTAQPAPHLYRLLPEALAARIAGQGPYEHGGERLWFRPVASPPNATGAELVSWPPLKHVPRGEGRRVWNYSAYIRVSLRTVPFSPIPRIHISVGIRRWVRGRVQPLRGQRASVYLLTNAPLVTGGPDSSRLAVAALERNGTTGEARWAHGGPAGMLRQLGALDNLPLAEVFAKEPENWIAGRDGMAAAVAHHTMMGYHGVAAGLMPTERRRLIEWAAAALAPQFQPIEPLHRVRARSPRKILEDPARSRKNASDDDHAHAMQSDEEVAACNARVRRQHVAAATGDGGLTVLALHQTDTIADRLVDAAEESLGLHAYRVQSGPQTWAWHTPELPVRVEFRPLGALGEPLGEGRVLRRSELDEAITNRSRAVRDYLREQFTSAGSPQAVLVELQGREAFHIRTSDPKGALRLGAAEAELVSQFLTPGEDQDNAPHRARAAWDDTLRQLGSRIVPATTSDEIPDELSQLAFWLVRRQVDSTSLHKQFTPIAALVRPGQNCILGRSPDTEGWVRYPTMLQQLTGRVRGDNLRTRQQQEAATASFVKQVLYQLRGEPMLVVTHAQNTRERWEWLTNPGLARDRIRIGGGPPQRLSLYGRQLRIARVATSQREETPQWWAPTSDQSGEGHSKGLWAPGEADDANRVFYSTMGKASTQKQAMEMSKLTPHVDAKDASRVHSRMPQKHASNPSLLELTMAGLQPGDDPSTWAAFLHQQRQAEDYAEDLGLPLVLHLAELADEYALPYEDAEEAVTEAAGDGFAGDEQLESDPDWSGAEE